MKSWTWEEPRLTVEEPSESWLVQTDFISLNISRLANTFIVYLLSPCCTVRLDHHFSFAILACSSCGESVWPAIDAARVPCHYAMLPSRIVLEWIEHAHGVLEAEIVYENLLTVARKLGVR